MIKKIIASLLGISLFSPLAHAKAEQPDFIDNSGWVLYDRAASDGARLVVRARTGDPEAERLLNKGLVSVVSCKADPAEVNDWGMPLSTDRLYPLEDKLNSEPILRAADAAHVANVTGQGERRMFFVHRTPIDLEAILGTFPVQGYVCSTSEVTDRQALIRLVTPTLLESQLSGDLQVITNLQSNGDDGNLPRTTDFWFYGEKAALNLLAERLKSNGFSINHWVSNPTGVVLSREMPVNFETFRPITALLLDTAEQSGVRYDGWETFVISPATGQPKPASPPTGD